MPRNVQKTQRQCAHVIKNSRKRKTKIKNLTQGFVVGQLLHAPKGGLMGGRVGAHGELEKGRDAGVPEDYF